MRRGAAAAAWKLRLLERRIPVLALILCVVVGAAARGGSGAAAQGQPTVYTGLGFDTCDAPSVSALQAWLASPYRALGVYIGGANRACPNNQLTATWVASVEGLGWALAPLYVGLQAPCASSPGLAKINPAAASSQGTEAADNALAAASQLGLPPHSPIYFDMEGYALANPACTQTVQTFLSAWVTELHAQGFLAGVYGSAASTMRDLQALTTTSGAPDDVWIGDWNGATSVFDPYVSDGLWASHQRIHQFSGGHHESYGGQTIDIDSDSFDAAVISASASASAPSAPVPPNPTPTPSPAPTLSAAGSVTTSDGVASVSWQAGTFARSVVVSLNPSLPAVPVAGFGSGGYGVQLQVQQTATSAPAANFAYPLSIHIAPQPAGLAPVGSSNGTTWQALPQLVGNLLPVGVAAGYAREPDGSFEIQTRGAGFYALLPDSTPPPAPATLSGHFSNGSLVLSWPASTGPAGAAVAYQVSLTGQPLLSVSGQTVAALRAFHPDEASVYRVAAVDAAGNVSLPSPPLVVLPTKRPAGVPRPLPPWAWSLFTWQQQGRVGLRPYAPTPLPHWFWNWRAWRISPFHLAA